MQTIRYRAFAIPGVAVPLLILWQAPAAVDDAVTTMTA